MAQLQEVRRRIVWFEQSLANKVFLSISSGFLLLLSSISSGREEESGEERCVATTNDASGQPMAGGERHRMASRVQILMHYARFVFYGTGWIGVCKVY